MLTKRYFPTAPALEDRPSDFHRVVRKEKRWRFNALKKTISDGFDLPAASRRCIDSEICMPATTSGAGIQDVTAERPREGLSGAAVPVTV